MVKRIVFFPLIIISVININLSAQNINFNKDFNFYFESALNFDSLFHYTIKPYKQNYYKKLSVPVINVTNPLLWKVLNDNLISIKKKQFNFTVNPIFSSVFFNDFSDNIFYADYKAGLNFQTSYKNKLFINSDFFFSETEFPSFTAALTDEFGIVPHFGKFLKKNNTALLYYSWTGNIRYQVNNYISFSTGRGKHFLGNGYRSLFLSYNANAYPYFKVEVDIWKIKYLWMAAKLSDVDLSNETNSVLYDKAVFIHYFSLNLTKRINFDFFEAVITNPFDKDGRRISYDAAYFNPVIFYRPAEFYKGTSDNSLMGLGLNIKLWESTFLYSQFILDDMVISSLSDGSGWWGNKFGIQAGIKIYNLLKIPGLFVRAEINGVRPYTYSHGEAYVNKGIANLNYGNFRQEAAHPSGANFAEGIALIRYVKGRFSAKIKIISAIKGEDTDSVSYGGDVYKSYNLRPNDFGISFLQGTLTDYHIVDFGLAYVINPQYGLMFKAGFYYQNRVNQFLNQKNQILYFGFSGDIFNSFTN